VIHAGLSGLIAAEAFRTDGFDVTLFEKSRSMGGRTATRREDAGWQFDHGAQYFTARDPGFQNRVEGGIGLGFVAEWTGRVVKLEAGRAVPLVDQPKRYVGVPGMKSVAAALAAEFDVRYGTKIIALRREPAGWFLTDESGCLSGPFDRLIVTLPAPQAADLLGDHPLAAIARSVAMTPCWAVLLGFADRVAVDWDGAFVNAPPFSWVCQNSSKPGRDANRECWVLHASPEWSQANLALSEEDVIGQLTRAFETIVGQPLPASSHRDAHRWMFSASPEPKHDRSLHSPDGLTLCGDWLAGGRVEGAYLSGLSVKT
jgi:renalase